MKKTDEGLFYIYSRKSRFTGKGESIDNQIELCKQHIAMKYGEEAAKNARVYEDEGFSGGNLERPQFKKMMKDSQTFPPHAIVVYRLDRISRNIGDFAGLIEDLGARKIDFISIKEQFDTSTPIGRAMMYIASVFSQLERETIAERIRDNMRELSKTGRWLGGTTPTGYASESISHVTIDGKTKKACKLKIVPEEAETVKLIFEKFMETGSLTKVDAFLLSEGYRTKNGKPFTRFAIKGILSNPAYMIADGDAYDYLTKNEVELYAEREDFDGKSGIMAYNRTLQRAGKSTIEKPMNEWVVSIGKHEGLIAGAKWVAVQSLLTLNKSKSYKKPRGNVALLSGLLFCGNCGDYMRPKLTGRRTAEGETIYHYLCTTKEHSNGKCCAMKNPNGNILDKKVIEELKKLGQNRAEYIAELDRVRKSIKGGKEDCEAKLSEIKHQIEENEQQIGRLTASLARASGTAAEQYIFDEIEKLHNKNKALAEKQSELKALSSDHVLADVEADILGEVLTNFMEGVDGFSVEQKRAAIRVFVKKAVWDGENVHLYIFGSDDVPKLPAGLDFQPQGGDSGDFEPSGEDSE